MISTGSHHGFESSAEQHALLALDFAGDVVFCPVAAVPACIRHSETEDAAYLITFAGMWIAAMALSSLAGAIFEGRHLAALNRVGYRLTTPVWPLDEIAFPQPHGLPASFRQVCVLGLVASDRAAASPRTWPTHATCPQLGHLS
jgi:hypothetical protein